ncbi:disease resistance RPP13-like protein 4 [Prunus yedoensis var. nudiflora]|uniref:Disease resistance RPP13-like protein 4 n=1 Tax=Prunus yedoensis var. nudiflora TaxID=2094558 RepID=A0A315B4H1_PRUYE|nr:disease resistance RPP13-like protein 4 [Prunus yedoensis var. nudiflora]
MRSSSASTSRNAEKFLPKLLDRLGKAKAKAIENMEPGDDQEVVLSRFKKIEDELQQMEDLKLLPTVTLWEHNLFNQFTDLERRVDKFFLGDDEDNAYRPGGNHQLRLA